MRPLCLVALVALAQAGCTSAITTAYLRDAWLDGGEHAEESAAIAAAADDAPNDDAPVAGPKRENGTTEVDASRRAAAIEEAVARLSKLGTLDDTARATLIETLRRTQQEDWPVVVEAFAETLAASGAPPAVAAAHVVAKAPSDPPVDTPADKPADTATPPTAGGGIVAPPADAPAPEPPQPPAEATTVTPPAEPVPPLVAAAVPGPTLAVQNAAFASRVRAWGDLDRFPASRFRPGQEVIVYFELENLSANAAPAGHTTCIDTVIRLVGPSGESVHDWSFEPIAETLKTRRRDYFARYVVRMPEGSPPGACHLEVRVTDTLAGTTAETVLPLELVAE